MYRRVILMVACVALAAAMSLAATTQSAPALSAGAKGVSPHTVDALVQPAWQPQGQLAHLLPTLEPHAAGTTNTSNQTSTNWSGFYDTGPSFTSVGGQWVVPTVLPSQSSENSSTWVGVDGANNSCLIQTGTAQDSYSTGTDYYDWYEIITPSDPAPETVIGNVAPGDHMLASVAEVIPGTWRIAITDSTSGLVFSQQFSYAGPLASAEWIEEAPTINSQQSTLADFGSAQFTNISAGHSGSPAVTQTPLDMVNGSGSVIASPGSVTGNAFTITYDGPGPTAGAAATSTTVSVNPTAAAFGSAVSYSTSVSSSGGTPTGTVTFSVGSSTLCTTGALVSGSGSCSTTAAPQGTDTVLGTFSGSSSFAQSSSTTTLDISAPAHGYWLVGSDGGIFTFGSAQFYGSAGSLKLQRPVVGITPTGDRVGYWLVASDGGIFTYGDAVYFGSIPGLGIAPAGTSGSAKKLNAPIVGMVPTFDRGGYFMVASDGGVFTFGDAKFEGSCPAIGGCSGAAVSVTPDASGNGYWLVTATGHVYTFGDAAYLGAPGPQTSPVTAAVRTPDGGGYWVLLADGTVDAYGDAINLGGPASQTNPAERSSAIFSTSDGKGYWVTSASGDVYSYGDAPYDGNIAGTKLNGAIIAATGF
jgi:hypothetical protein